MLGGAGIGTTSLAQSRRVGTGVERGGARDGGHETVMAGGSDTAAATKGTVYDETAHLGDDWGELGWVDCEPGTRGEQGASVGIGSVVNNMAGV
jgi:hypothetical protein